MGARTIGALPYTRPQSRRCHRRSYPTDRPPRPPTPSAAFNHPTLHFYPAPQPRAHKRRHAMHPPTPCKRPHPPAKPAAITFLHHMCTCSVRRSLNATTAIKADENDTPLNRVQAYLGHANASTTRLYGHSKSRPKDSAVRHARH